MASLQDQLLKLQSDQPSSNSQEEATAFSRVCAVLKRVGLDPEKMTPDTVLEDAGSILWIVLRSQFALSKKAASSFTTPTCFRLVRCMT